MSKVFEIEYRNENSSLNGTKYPVRIIDAWPDHYFISDGQSHFGGGKLLRKYCFPIETIENIYYVVTKQLNDIYGFEETTGWKTVIAYSIQDSKLIKLAEIELHNTDNSETMLLEHLEEEELIDSTKTFKLIQL